MPGGVETAAGNPVPAWTAGEQAGHRASVPGAGGGAPAGSASFSIAAATGPGGGAQVSPDAAAAAQAGAGRAGEAALAASLKGGSAASPSSPHGSAGSEEPFAPPSFSGASGRPGGSAVEAPGGPSTQAAAPSAERSRIAPDDASSRGGVPVAPPPSQAEDQVPEMLVGSPTGAVGATSQAGSGGVSASPSPAGPTIANVPLGAVAVEIGLKTLAGVNHFDIRLNPEELGGVEVRLAIEGGEVKASLIVDRVETLGLLQREAKTLERAFEQAGLKPSEGGIDLTLRDPQGQGRGQGHHDERGPRRDASTDRAAAQAGPNETPPSPRMLWRTAGGVDLRI